MDNKVNTTRPVKQNDGHVNSGSQVGQVAAGTAKSATNLGAGEKNLTNNSTLNVVPTESPVKEDRSAYNCKECKGEGLQNPEDPKTGLCQACKGTGKA